MKNDNYPFKLTLKQFKEELVQQFNAKKNIITIAQKLVNFIDQSLLTLFQKNYLHQDDCFCLIALGSYGRQELQLHSDIDILLLHTNALTDAQLLHAQAFIQNCWDNGFGISHQITTVKACADLASQDVSVISSILDMRLLCGHSKLMEELHYQTHTLHMWPSEQYFFAKQQEQHQRYQKYGETASNLEPNVKYGPGGLRDIQILLSISKRHFNIKKLADGINFNFITDKEYEELINCQHFLWRVRFALHALAGKPEERLLFDYQVKLAALFGYQDKPHSLAIEQFMKAYFQAIKRSREINEMLLQWFSETIIHKEKQQLKPLNAYFQLSNQFIEVKHTKVFSTTPTCLLELFLWIAKCPTIVGVRASTIRLIRQYLYLIGTNFRNSTAARQCFLAIFKEGINLFDALNYMNKYGVLSHYLDCFAAVTGQMQYDLFHVYTVDQHTLFVIRNLCRFLDKNYANQFPLAVKLMATIQKREILYLAALFHDIAKGRGGDHSELGAHEAQEFASQHQLSQDDANLLVWLVKHHLLMSHTAQRQDIYDPKTIQHFCMMFPKPSYLDYLYLLTVADICATNQRLWNTWKDSLLKELHRAATEAFQQQETLLNENELIDARKQQALTLLKQQGFTQAAVEQLWSSFKPKYFLHESADIIAVHTKAILTCQSYPLVLILPHYNRGGIEVFIYMPHRDDRFTIATTVLSNHHTTIQEAIILTCDNQFDLDTYIILNEQHQAFLDQQRMQLIEQELTKRLGNTKDLPRIAKHRLSRTLAHFKIKPEISFNDEFLYTRLFLVAADRPGLLAHVSRVFTKLNLHLHNAKIVTAGEKAEDTFYISTKTDALLSLSEKELLQKLLIKELSTEF
ncbi:Cytosine/adenosine deaminase [Legionella beliardensis]|uniref:Bifunctional uridylyltransferase/uridylyl-removing enzyme n=1 Tax=Legionella beliardensis TaxID=91822 RepID=A0A378I3D0_9GAMM|nr:[protein-PII] uridylyltransferase [Legionella beliardensis]STX29270.1 Cytosine/adenosine deaminase [Legionella beliardensis]